MKCMDCVSVCPKDALYFGFGRPARAKGPAKYRAPTPRFDLTGREEVILLVIFALTFLSVLGAYKSVPYLMASGIAAVVTFLMWKSWRLLRDANVTLQRHRLKLNGRLKRSGAVVATLAIAATTFTVQCAALRVIAAAADRYAKRVVLDRKLVFSDDPRPLSPAMSRDAARAITLYGLLHSIPQGGLGLFDDPTVNGSVGWLHLARLEFGEAERSFRSWLERNGRAEPINMVLGRVLRAQHKQDQATQYYYELLAAEPTWDTVVDDAISWHLGDGRLGEAVRLRRCVLAHDPENVSAMRNLAFTLLDADETEEGTQLLREALKREPDHVWSLASLARVLAFNGQLEEAHQTLARALTVEPEDAALNRAMARLLAGMNRDAEAARFFEEAERLEGK